MKLRLRITLYLLSALILTHSLPSHSMASAPVVQIEPTQAHYLEVTGSDTNSFIWSITPRPDGTVSIIMESDGDRFENICRKTGETLEWHYSDGESTLLSAKRTNTTITIRGNRLGEKIDTAIKIDERPWYQPLSFSLRGFLDSDRRQTSFWTIRANTLEVHALKAEKKGAVTIETVAGPMVADQVEIRVEGMLARFWHANYWYRQQDGLFLRYSSVHGPFGTAATEVTLTSAGSGESGS